MKKIILGAIIALGLIGCGSSTTNYEEGAIPDPNGTNSQAVVINNTGDGDITVNQTVLTGNGTYLYGEDGNVAYLSGDGSIYQYPDGSIDEVSPISGTFSATYTETECVANGYFFCPLAQQCMNSPTNGSSCSI